MLILPMGDGTDPAKIVHWTPKAHSVVSCCVIMTDFNWIHFLIIYWVLSMCHVQGSMMRMWGVFISKERQTSSGVINTILMIGHHRALTRQHQGPSNQICCGPGLLTGTWGLTTSSVEGSAMWWMLGGERSSGILEVQSRHPTQVLGEAIIVSVWREVTFELSLERWERVGRSKY